MADVAVSMSSGPKVLTTAAVTLYSAPTGTTSIIRNIHVNSRSSSAEWFTMSLGTDSTASRIYEQQPLTTLGTTGAVFDFNGMIVLKTTQTIQAFASSTGVVTMTISGIESA